jgi:hypothetical protein
VPAPSSGGKSRDFAGSLFGVSGRYVQDAKTLFHGDRKLFQTVFEGKLPLSQAKRQYVREHGAKKEPAADLTVRRVVPEADYPHLASLESCAEYLTPKFAAKA